VRKTVDQAITIDKPSRRYGGLSVAQRRAERRARLLAAGLQLFGTAGFLKTSIPMICNASGVTARHFYEEFPSREALLRTILDEIAEHAHDIVREHLRATEKPVYERMLASNRAYYSYFTDDPRRARIYALESLGVSPELEAHRRALRERSIRQLTRATEVLEPTGVLHDLDSRLISIGLGSAAVAILAEWVLATNKPTVEKMAEMLTIFWTRTLRLDSDGA
jgi:AcrR family transcriptional regulator